MTPAFYEVEKKIILALEDLGFEVVWIENKDLPLDYHGTRSKTEIPQKTLLFYFLPLKYDILIVN